MKNAAIGANGSEEPPAARRRAIALLDQDLRRRGAAAGTRAIYGRDVEELARWAAPVRRPDGRARARAADGLAQARRAAGLLPRPRRARPDGEQPGRPARLAEAPA